MLTAGVQVVAMKLSFSQWLKLRRDIAGVTQSQIAQELKVRPQTISNWEKGVSNPSLDPDQTLRLCLLLKITLEDLAKGFRGEITLND
jgi:transcriptional regulator with XRE-family HTH domain